MKKPKSIGDGSLKLGGPSSGEVRETLRMISFRVDEETDLALKKIVAAEAGPGSLRARSTVLRRLILAEALKL